MEIKLHFFKDRRLIFLTLLNLAMVGVLVVIITLVITRDKATRLAHERLSQFSNHQENWRRIVGVWSATAASRAMIDEYFITPSSLPLFIEQLESLANTTAVQLQLTTVEVTTPPQPLLNLNFTAIGSLAKVRHFWTLLDKLPGLSTVAHLELREHSTNTTSALWALTVKWQLAHFQHDKN